MAISFNEKNNFVRTVTGVTTGNETIFKIPQGLRFVIEAVPTSAGEASAYTLANSTRPSSFDDMLPIDTSVNTTAFQESPLTGGQRWVGVKVDSGTWTVTVSLEKEF